jgi:hypothetical protein
LRIELKLNGKRADRAVEWKKRASGTKLFKRESGFNAKYRETKDR